MTTETYTKQEVIDLVKGWMRDEINHIDFANSFPKWMNDNHNWKEQLTLVEYDGEEHEVTRATVSKITTLIQEDISNDN